MAVTALLNRAKQAIESGETSLHAAAEDIAAAKAQGAKQREIAKVVGKSAAWVNRLLKWRESGYQEGSAFGPQAKASRQRAKRVQATKQRKPATTSEQAQAATARARADATEAEAAKAKADAEKAKAEAAKAKADAEKAKAEADTAKAKADAQKAKANARAHASGVNGEKKAIHSGPRELLVKALGMLGSDHHGERANAAIVVEKQRAMLGMTWDELIISADEVEARAA
jgi:hypothetical protein